MVAGLLIVATGWNFKATAEMPEKYVNKEEQRIFIDRNDDEHKRISEKLDRIIDHLLQRKTNE